MRIVAPTDPAASPTAASAAPAVAAVSEIRSLRLEAGGPLTRPLVDTRFERREETERELDRVQNSLLAERATYGQQLNWLMLSQALLLNAFLIVLVFGWSTPLPGKRLLLAGLAAFAAAVAVLIVLALRGTRDAVMSLHQHRKQLEATLQKDFGRAPVFAPRAMVTRGLATAANGLLPATFVAGWIAITLYALAAPLGATAADATAAANASPAARAAPARSTNRPAPNASSTASAAAAAGTANAANAADALVPMQPVAPRAAPLHPDDEAAARGQLR
ncbi:MAG: hypothetical protein MUC68_15275 [Burkholderiaceae bacterium]|jgi:hypothetical protein|nr:hypothetical protein [Burkholderiaceae bacterium]